MKISTIIVFLIITQTAFCQHRRYTCDEISKSILDSSLVVSHNGKLMIKDFNSESYLISVNNVSYYVGKRMMRDIKKSARRNKCKGVKIEKLETVYGKKATRD